MGADGQPRAAREAAHPRDMVRRHGFHPGLLHPASSRHRVMKEGQHMAYAERGRRSLDRRLEVGVLRHLPIGPIPFNLDPVGVFVWNLWIVSQIPASGRGCVIGGA